jgi:RND family efflux transporter MFP subunit
MGAMLRPALLSLLLGTPAAAQGLAPVGCLIEPFDVVELASPVGGIVAEVHVRRGDVVAAGQEVARLDTALEVVELEAARLRADDDSAIRAAQTRLDYLSRAADRTARLAARAAIAESAAEEARMEAETARAALEEARLARKVAEIEARAVAARLSRRILHSPVGGLVTERHVSPGEYRDGSGPVVTVARMDRLTVEAFVPIAYFPDLAVGQTVTIRPEPPVGGAHAATITAIDRVFDAASATLGVVMELPNPDLALPAGLRCELDFVAP